MVRGEVHELAEVIVSHWRSKDHLPLSGRYRCTQTTPITMFPTRAQSAKNNLLLCFDAFNTLFRPNTPIPRAYAQAAIRHGVKCTTKNPEADVGREFKRAYKEASMRSPNYGKVKGLGAEKWWRNVGYQAPLCMSAHVRNIE